MIDELRERIATYLSHNQVCVISTIGPAGVGAIVARYRNRGLELDCRLPRWSDAIYHLEQDPHALVVILDRTSDSSCWMQYRGIARIDPSVSDDRYATVHITPERVDMIDESHGWGARETLEV